MLVRLLDEAGERQDAWGLDPYALRAPSGAFLPLPESGRAAWLREHSLVDPGPVLADIPYTNGYPHIIHWVWVGEPLTRLDFRENLERTLTDRSDALAILWTDLTAESTSPAARDMLGWATGLGVCVVPFSAVFGWGGPLAPFLHIERLRRSPASIADLMRICFLSTLGGLSIDFDVRFTGSIADAFVGAQRDVRVWMELVVPCNAVMASRPGSGLWSAYIDVVQAAYLLPYEVLRPGRQAWGQERLFREVLARTSPTALKRALDRFDPAWNPDTYGLDWTGLEVDYANSWLQPLPPAPPEDLLEAARELVTVVLFEGWNRPGILDLDALYHARPWLAGQEALLAGVLSVIREISPGCLSSVHTICIPKTETVGVLSEAYCLFAPDARTV